VQLAFGKGSENTTLWRFPKFWRVQWKQLNTNSFPNNKHHKLCRANSGPLLPKGNYWTARFLPLGRSGNRLTTLNMSHAGRTCFCSHHFHSCAETNIFGTTSPCKSSLPTMSTFGIRTASV